MPFSWSDYLRLGEWLVRNAGQSTLPLPSEAAYRSAVSRAYYAAFHEAKALVVRRNELHLSGDGSDHGAVIRAYKHHRAMPRKNIGNWLERLRDRRRRADYDEATEVNASLANAAVDDAKRIIQNLASQ